MTGQLYHIEWHQIKQKRKIILTEKSMEYGFGLYQNYSGPCNLLVLSIVSLKRKQLTVVSICVRVVILWNDWDFAKMDAHMLQSWITNQQSRWTRRQNGAHERPSEPWLGRSHAARCSMPLSKECIRQDRVQCCSFFHDLLAMSAGRQASYLPLGFTPRCFHLKTWDEIISSDSWSVVRNCSAFSTWEFLWKILENFHASSQQNLHWHQQCEIALPYKKIPQKVVERPQFREEYKLLVSNMCANRSKNGNRTGSKKGNRSQKGTIMRNFDKMVLYSSLLTLINPLLLFRCLIKASRVGNTKRLKR